MYAHTSLSVQSASGFALTSPNLSSHSTFLALARVGAWSRRTPVIQASTEPSARFSGSTLRIEQHLSGALFQSSSPCSWACSSSVRLW